MKKINGILFSLFFFLLTTKEAHTMDPPEGDFDEEIANASPHVLPDAPIIEDTGENAPPQKKKKRKKKKKKAPPTTGEQATSLGVAQGPGNLFKRQGNSLFCEKMDDKNRTIKTIISSEKFNELNQPFAQIDAAPFNKLTATQINEVEFEGLIKGHTKSSPNFFSLIDGEGVLFQGTQKNKLIPFFATGGVHNCVAIALHGKNSKNNRIFSALVHFARGNTLESLNEFLTPLSKYQEQHIDIRSHYKSETLLNIFKYIRSKELRINSVYVNDAHHSVKDNEITITYHPTYFGKNNINDINISQSLQDLMSPITLEIRRSSAVILTTKTGTILEIPDKFVIDARQTFEALRPPEYNKEQAYKNIQVYDISPS